MIILERFHENGHFGANNKPLDSEPSFNWRITSSRTSETPKRDTQSMVTIIVLSASELGTQASQQQHNCCCG